MLAYGMYIGHDVEIVITEKTLITFRRVKSQNALESCLLEKDEAGSQYTCVAVCRSLPATTIDFPKPRKWAYAFLGGKRIYSNNKALTGRIGTANPTLQQHRDEICLEFPDGDSYSARIAEAFSMEDLHPLPPPIREDNIAECLQNWHMGCYQEAFENGISVTINTREHMYIFQARQNDFYCRAARYRTCNSGVVFNQNFRQRSGDLSETYMVEDNTVASERLEVVDDQFGVCQVIDYDGLMRQNMTERERLAFCHRYGLNGAEKKTQAELANLLGISRASVSRIQKKGWETMVRVIPKPAGNNIYWTVAGWTDEKITLNGCQGDVYEWGRGKG